MKKLILFGATGHVGREVAQAAAKYNYKLTVVVRHAAQAATFTDIAHSHVVADATVPTTLLGICTGYDIVVSAMGKSVSLRDKGMATYHEVDFLGNAAILKEAQKAGVPKFVYVSAFQSERYNHLAYFKAHYDMEQLLLSSGIDYSIVKPPAVFSAFVDALVMAKHGKLVHIGKGDKVTNPIYEGDLARVIVDAIHLPYSITEAGGKEVYTRRQMNNLMQDAMKPGKQLRTVPLGIIKAMLPIVRLFDKNMHDKLAFYLEVQQHDVIAPKMGVLSFDAYIKLQMEDMGNRL